MFWPVSVTIFALVKYESEITEKIAAYISCISY